jgi:uncharacterized protein
MDINQKYNNLQDILKSLGKMLVAYSGGVDSTFLLKAAVEAVGSKNVLACIAAGASLPKSQYEQALALAKQIGAEVRTVEPTEMTDSKFTQNAPDRCFHCKSHLFEILLDIAKREGFSAVVYGNNYDDKSDFRPGTRAAEKYGIKAPLMLAELGKAEIRELSRGFGLPTADMPASPCLASRVPYGIDITSERLMQVEKAEEFLRKLGLVEFRVRHHGDIARIEVRPEQMGIVVENRIKIVEFLKSLGFAYVCVDLQGFRSGSLNEPLSQAQKNQSL